MHRARAQKLNFVMKDSKNVRIIDIANKVGVSKGTVDRVMHNRGDVKKETRDKIQAAIAELGYKPNLLAKTLSGKKSYVIAVVIPCVDAKNPYWEKLHLGVDRASQEVSDFNTQVEFFTFSPSNPDTFLEAMTQVLEQGVDAVVLHPFFQQEAFDFSVQLDSADIPYVYIDIDLEKGNNLAYFGQNAFQSGYVAAKLMDMSISSDSRVLVLKLANNIISHHLRTREEGFLSYFSTQDNRNIVCHSLQVDLQKEGELERVIEEQLSGEVPVSGVFIPGSRVFRVAELLTSKSDIRLIGYDLIEQNVTALNEGSIDVLISQKPVEQGYATVMGVFRYLMSHVEMPKINYSPVDIIVKENVNYYNEGK